MFLVSEKVIYIEYLILVSLEKLNQIKKNSDNMRITVHMIA